MNSMHVSNDGVRGCQNAHYANNYAVCGPTHRTHRLSAGGGLVNDKIYAIRGSYNSLGNVGNVTAWSSYPALWPQSEPYHGRLSGDIKSGWDNGCERDSIVQSICTAINYAYRHVPIDCIANMTRIAWTHSNAIRLSFYRRCFGSITNYLFYTNIDTERFLWCLVAWIQCFSTNTLRQKALRSAGRAYGSMNWIPHHSKIRLINEGGKSEFSSSWDKGGGLEVINYHYPRLSQSVGHQGFTISPKTFMSVATKHVFVHGDPNAGGQHPVLGGNPHKPRLSKQKTKIHPTGAARPR